MDLVELIIFLLTCAGLTSGIVLSSLFSEVRIYIDKKSSFIGELINCPMCTGFWVGAGVSCFFSINPVFAAFSASFFSWSLIQVVDSISKIGDYYMEVSENMEEE